MTKNIICYNWTGAIWGTSAPEWGSLVTKTWVHGERKNRQNTKKKNRDTHIKGFVRLIITLPDHMAFYSLK